jgi:polysaccharide export outer membrane protein
MLYFPDIPVRLLCALVLVSGGAAAQNPAGSPSPQAPPRTEAEKPAPKTAEIPVQGLAAPVDPNTYIIGSEDVLSVRVWRENDLSVGVVVRPDGKITIPLAGDVQAAGLTPTQLAAKITEAYSKFLNRPEVSVSVQQVQSRRYFITGKVVRPGAVPLVTPTTVLDAITMAGGLQDFAKKSKIVIMRGKERLKFNYNEVIKGKKVEQNINLQPGDYIVVP